MPFKPFNRKRTPKPPKPLRVWNAEVQSRLEPLALTPGSEAVHVVEVDNFDELSYELEVSARCRGPRLCYGKSADWTHGPVVCSPGAHTAPAARHTVSFPHLSDPAEQISTPEQIAVELTMTLVDDRGRRFDPETRTTVHTIALARA